MMSTTPALKRLLNPATIAIFGGKHAEIAISQCRAAGFKGEIWAVNPNRKTLAGLSCFESASKLPAVPDSCFLATPPQASIETIRELAALGACGAVCFAAGFSELGPQGIQRQEELRRAAGDMAIIGPNCHGFLNYFDGVALWPDEHGGQRVERGIALILQSGNLGINMTMQQRGLDIGYVVSIGNKVKLDLHDYIEFLIADPRVTAIGLHIESIDKVHEFSKAGIKALKAGIPIVVMKTGRSRRGAEVTLSHTGSLAGSESLYSALFQRLGMARCNSIGEFLETLKFLSTVGVLDRNTVGSMSCSGGEASLIADYAEDLDLEMPELTSQSVTELQQILGPAVHISNPLDYHTYAWGNYRKLTSCFAAMLRNNFACTMLVLDYPLTDEQDVENWLITERALIDAASATSQCAVIVATLPESLPLSARTRLLEANITPMQGLEHCLWAIKAAVFIGAAQATADGALAVHQAELLEGSAEVLDEWESKAEIEKFGLTIPPGQLCVASDTASSGEMLGFPVVLKAVSKSLSHKSELNAVALNLVDGAAVQAATANMTPLFSQFLVEKMVSPTVAEFIIGVSRDPAFGLTLMVGAGGKLVELLDDTVSLLLPVRRQDILTAVQSLKVSKLLDSYRGDPAGDLEALLDAVESVAAYALANNASLLELDINPLIVMPKGAVAVDVFIRKSTGH